VYEITRAVVRNIKIPVFAKLTPNASNIGEIAKAAINAGAYGIAAINTVGPGMAIDIDIGKPILANKFGGVSGPAIKPIAVASVFKIYEAVDIPVIGVGGVSTGRDAIEMMMAGASAVAIGTAVYYRGIEVFGLVEKEMKEWMKENGVKKISEIVGAAHG
jgi:dihydroorotate dehydrogenase (NAD+) catalytic subunit